MTTAAPEKTLDRIRKYLAIAEHPNTGPEEAETFRERAYNLMAKHGIERAHLAAAGQITDELSSWALVIDKTHQAERIHLLASIVGPKTCRAVQWKVNGVTYVMVSGYQSDLEVVKMLFASLSLQMAKEVANVKPSGRKSLSTARKSFMAGFASSVFEKLRQANKAATAEADSTNTGRSTELVLRDRQAAVDAYYKSKVPATGAVKSRPIGDPDAFLAGREAGERADLGGGARLGSSGQRAISA
ncbi:DUF2786 domain-containing protein [Nonomuraea terrae]|uniref:DUF2786 domain-containing protein n=1 Tax=Nonomuraea terrae TaxID=2530383 RepID=UPI0014048A28|nr:DUF2786 domain-containing protein [Nonomuraea terrae]